MVEDLDVEERLYELANLEGLSVGAAREGILRFVLQKMADEPEEVSVRDVADVLSALAKSDAGGDATVDEGLLKWIQSRKPTKT